MKNIWILLAVMVFAVGCNDNSTEEGSEVRNLLTLSAENLSFLVDGTSADGDNTVTITSDGDWRLAGYESWCTPSVTSGKSGDKVTFTVAENPSDDARSAVYTFIRGNKAVKLTVAQLQNSIFEPVSGGSLSLNALRQTVTFVVRSSFDFSPEIDAPWIVDADAEQSRGVETRFLRFLIDANDDYSGRTGTIKVTDVSGAVHELVINQNQKHAIISSKKFYDVDAAGGTITVSLDSNVDYIVSSSGYSWIAEETTRALDPSQKIFRIAASADTRQGQIIFKYSPADGSSAVADTVFIAQRIGPGVKFTVPDANFRYYLSKSDYAFVKAGEQTCEMTAKGAALTAMSCTDSGIKSLQGIEAFPLLTSLNCSNNKLTELNLPANTALKTLNCNSNLIAKLDIASFGAFTSLTSLTCTRNKLTELELPVNTALTTLDCGYNMITKLDLINCSTLKSLKVDYNPLEELVMGPDAAITSVMLLALYNSERTVYSPKLTVTAPGMTSITCYNNKLTELDVSGCPALTTLNCYLNQLTALDVSANTLLTTLGCHGNALKTLDVSANLKLTSLTCVLNPDLLTLYMAEGQTIKTLTKDKQTEIVYK